MLRQFSSGLRATLIVAIALLGVISAAAPGSRADSAPTWVTYSQPWNGSQMGQCVRSYAPLASTFTSSSSGEVGKLSIWTYTSYAASTVTASIVNADQTTGKPLDGSSNVLGSVDIHVGTYKWQVEKDSGIFANPPQLVANQLYALVLTTNGDCDAGWAPSDSGGQAWDTWTSGWNPAGGHKAFEFTAPPRPTVSLYTPADNATYLEGAIVNADYSCTDLSGSGLASCTGSVADGMPIDTSLGEHTFSVTAIDNFGDSNTVSHTYNVSSLLPGNGGPWYATEGKPVKGTLGTFADSHTTARASSFIAETCWGDGSSCSTATVSGSAGEFTVTGSHTYAEEGPYTAVTTVTDLEGNTATISTTVYVYDAPLALAGPVRITVKAGTTKPVTVAVNFTDANEKAPVSDYTASIDWGDDTTDTGTITARPGGGWTLTASHTYTDTHHVNYPITITINDIGGASVTATGAVKFP